MAVGIARRVFGPSHTIRSAGAETSGGEPAASNAVTVMSEIGCDISEHSSVDIATLDLASFDLIVVFRPSAAESVSVPRNVRVEYLDVRDPLGHPLDTYRTAARSIQRGVRRLYVEDALRRTSGANNPAGSHLFGILSRAAKECEKEVAEFVTQHLGVSAHEKVTLGQLARCIEEHAASHNTPELAAISTAVAQVNDLWVKLKHREDPAPEDMIAGLEGMLKVFQLLDNRLTSAST